MNILMLIMRLWLVLDNEFEQKWQPLSYFVLSVQKYKSPFSSRTDDLGEESTKMHAESAEKS